MQQQMRRKNRTACVLRHPQVLPYELIPLLLEGPVHGRIVRDKFIRVVKHWYILCRNLPTIVASTRTPFLLCTSSMKIICKTGWFVIL